jgi:hypothetical protein
MIVLPQIAENASTMMYRTTPRLDQKREVNYVANFSKKSQIVCMAHVAQGVLVVAGHQWSLAGMPSCLGAAALSCWILARTGRLLKDDLGPALVCLARDLRVERMSIHWC